MPFCADLYYRNYDGGASSSTHPTILIHGLGGTHLSWPPTLRRIPGQRIIAIDLPGHGLSKNSALCSAHSLAIYLRKFISEMGIYHFALVGHSMGSAVAFEFACLFPKQLCGLALISSGRVFNNSDELRLAFDNKRSMDKVVGFLSKNGFYAGFPTSLRQEILTPLKKTRLSVLRADLDVCESFLADCSAVNFLFPVQLITGREDQLVPLIGVKKLKYCLPNASLEIINECGHMSVFEKTEAVRTILVPFLKGATKSGNKVVTDTL